jgi:2-succinyl-6-hydroxy-2,4-cyclohexadiene-1-carboxylate synthase
MRIRVNNIALNIVGDVQNTDTRLPLLFLHGFTGRANDWSAVFERLSNQFLPFAIDLVGHGESDAPEETSPYTIPSIISDINEILDSLHYEKIGIIGYSMGGRIALSYAASYPERLKGIVLESSTPGLRSDKERKERISSDQELIKYIETHGVEKFVDYWLSHPLFNTQAILPRSVRNLNKSRKLKNSHIGLINSLHGSGTGAMAPLWDSLGQIAIPVLLITGELDTKFTEINREVDLLLPDSRHEIVKHAGHNVHLEKQEAFESLIISFFRNRIN